MYPLLLTGGVGAPLLLPVDTAAPFNPRGGAGKDPIIESDNDMSLSPAALISGGTVPYVLRHTNMRHKIQESASARMHTCTESEREGGWEGEGMKV